MHGVMSMSGLVAGVLAALLVCAGGCGPSYLDVGNQYLAGGNTAIAIEYFDAGSTRGGGAATRRALLRSYQIYTRDLERQIEFLKKQKQAYRALSQLTLLEEMTKRGETLKVPGASMAQVAKTTVQLRKAANEQLDEELSARRSRGSYLRSDLQLCRQLLALGSQRGGSVAENCQALREHFKSWATLAWTAGSSAASKGWLQTLQAEIMRRHPELIQVVASDHERLNAGVQVFLGRPSWADSGWYIVDRKVYRKAIAKRDRKGRFIKETVEVPPTQAQINAAKRAKKKKPKNRRIVKQVYYHVQGEWQKYQRTVKVQVPYGVTLQRGATPEERVVPLGFAGSQTTRAGASYERYVGARQANPRRKHTGPGARNKAERSLPSPKHLAARLIRGLPAHIANRILLLVE